MQETLIISPDASGTIRQNRVTVVPTPLDAIRSLESRPISTVILTGSYASNEELASVLREIYPAIRLERES